MMLVGLDVGRGDSLELEAEAETIVGLDLLEDGSRRGRVVVEL